MIRTLLIWLLVLALPAQGAIAASMVFCGPVHHASIAASETAPAAPDGHGEHGQQRHTAQAHDHASHGGSGATEPAQGGAPEPFAQSDTQKCSVCASCCSATAIYAAETSFSVPDPVTTVFDTLVPPVLPFTADGPDRPPRHTGA